MADKVTLRQFSEKLKEYESGGAARKAVGRFSGWSEDEKAKAHRMINQHFGVASKKDPTEPPRRRGRPPKAKNLTAGAPAAAAPKRRGRPPKLVSATSAPATPKRRGRPPKSSYAQTPTASEAAQAVKEPPMKKEAADPNTSARFLAERSMQALSTAISNTEAMHRIQPGLCLDSSLRKMVDLHNATLDIFAQALKGVVEVHGEKEKAAASPAPTPPTGARRGRPPKVEVEQPRGNGQGALEVGLTELPPFPKATTGSTSV